MREYCPEEIENLNNLDYCEVLYLIAKQAGVLKKAIIPVNGSDVPIEYVLLKSDINWSARTSPTKLNPFSPVGYDLNKLVENAILTKMTAFHNEYIFVFPDNVPNYAIKPVLIHEKTEIDELQPWVSMINSSTEIYMGNQSAYNDDILEARVYSHLVGCTAELNYVFEKGERFASKFSRWLLKLSGDVNDPSTFFNQVIPEFLSVYNRPKKSPLQCVIEFYLTINNTLLNDKEKIVLIDSYPWIKNCLPQVTSSKISEHLSFIFDTKLYKTK